MTKETDIPDAVALPPAIAALDSAVRGISASLDIELVLQLIVDRVRDLVDARYAALGIVDEDGRIVGFVTSGITDEQRRAIGELPRGRGLLGLIIRENRPYRISHIGTHPEHVGFPPNHPPMDSFLGVPIPVQDKVVGRLYLTDKQGTPEFSPEDQALVETFALHAGIAIENARLHDAVQRLAIVDERDRISRDLHDSAIQAIYAVTLSLEDASEVVATRPEEASRRVDDAIDSLHAVIRDIRQFIFGLRPVLLDTGSLMDGLRAVADELQRNTSVEIEIRGEDPEGLPLAVVAELLAIAREALANVARHAGAHHAWVRFSTTDGRMSLEVADDGRGFEPPAHVARGHHGLENMRARADALSGELTIDSGPGRGTRIVVAIPRPAVSPGLPG